VARSPDRPAQRLGVDVDQVDPLGAVGQAREREIVAVARAGDRDRRVGGREW
jgi:hypothetical protein